ncbi:MAG: hypothetical protein R3C20_19875 [Planctomycetaceae bacterium]
MNPYETPDHSSNPEESPPRRKSISRIMFIEVLIVVGIIAALVAWLPGEWNK